MKKNVFQQPRAEAKDTWTMPRREKGRTKSKDMTVAEPEMVYGQGRAVQGQGCLMQCIVPNKDRSFFEDLARVRSWKMIENQVNIEQSKAKRSAPGKKKLSRLEESIQQVERGEVWEYDSVDDMFNQILGKGWKAKTNTKAPAKTARVKRSVAAPKAETKRSAHLDKSLRQIENGEYFEAASAEEMCEQIFGKGRKAKTNKETSHHEPNACTVRAMKDALAGRVFRAKSPQDLIQQILG